MNRPTLPSASGIFAAPGQGNTVVVGVSAMEISRDPRTTFATFSLGSCIGLTVYDPVTQVGGLLHAMLPDSAINPEKARRQPAMFVDTGVPALFRGVYALGGVKGRLQVKLIGGAQFLDEKHVFNIGSRNVEAVLGLLRRNGVALAGQETGGQNSRTVRLELATGTVTISVPSQPIRTL